MECGQPASDAAPPVAPFAVSAASVAPPSPQSYTPKHLAEKILASRAGLEGERKQVTVLFADVVGSTELIRDLDPEDAQRLLDGAVTRMMDAVHRFEGTVSRSMGDGIMALFGVPLAHEDHAVRACYAALALQEAIGRYADDARSRYGVRIQARVGLNSGEVIVRLISDDLHMDYTAMGQTVHLASRMEQVALPGGVALTPDVLNLVEGYVQVKSLGLLPIKGLAAPLETFELVGVGALRSRLQVAAARGLTRFVGRQAELDALHAALELARTGHGQVAALVGEPGVGKSRLVWELTHSHRTEGWAILESSSVSYGRATSYLSVIDLLKGYCRIEPQDDARAVREKVAGKVLMLDRALEPTLPALLALLDMPTGDPAWEALEPGQRRRQTIDAVRRLLLRESREQPLLLVFEDLHWIDPETQAVLDALLDSLPTAQILLLVNFRPEYTHTWSNRGYYTQLRIDPLGQESAEELLAGLLGSDPSVQSVAELLAERTAGNPLFIEESVRMLVEQGALAGERGAYRLMGDLASVRVPPTVQAILASRIDRLPPEQKQLLQTAAVVGKDVPEALLRAVVAAGQGTGAASSAPTVDASHVGALLAAPASDDLQRGLAALQVAEFLYEASLFPEIEYTFKHALTHEVTYGSLLRERRRQLHAALVGAVERVYATRLEEQTERLVHHALRGELWERAVTYCQESGLRESRRSVYTAARERFEQALDAIGHLPETRERLDQTYELQVGLRAALAALVQLEPSIEVAKAAIATATRLGDPARLAQALILPGAQLAALGRTAEAIDFLERGLAVAEVHGDEMIAAMARQNIGFAHIQGGQPRLGVESLERAIEALAPVLPLASFERTGVNTHPPALSRAHLAWCLGELGAFDRASALAAEAWPIAEATGHAWTILLTLSAAFHAYLRRGDFAQATVLLERLLSLAQASGHPIQFNAHANLAVVHGLLGRSDEARPHLDAWRVWRAAVHGRAAPPVQLLLAAAEAALILGHPDEARELVEQVVEVTRARRHPGYEAAGLRLLGEVGRRSGLLDAAAAEQAYRDALVLAEAERLRPLQARCHLGLGQLLRKLCRPTEARAELLAATSMLTEMGMAFWLPEAEAALAEVAQ